MFCGDWIVTMQEVRTTLEPCPSEAIPFKDGRILDSALQTRLTAAFSSGCRHRSTCCPSRRAGSRTCSRCCSGDSEEGVTAHDAHAAAKQISARLAAWAVSSPATSQPPVPDVAYGWAQRRPRQL